MRGWKTDSIVLGFPDYREPAGRLAAAAGLDYADIEIRSFPDGESLVRLPAALPPRVVFCRSLDQPNARLVELELAAGAALELGAEQLTLVAPYLCYMRQDTAFRPGEAVSQRIIGALLARRFDTLITVDPHLHRTHSLGEAVPVRRAVALSAAEAMADELAARRSRPLLIGPDAESEQWVGAIAEAAGLDFGVARKERKGDCEVIVQLPALDFAGRHVVLIDDVVSTGRTLLEAARQILSGGAASVEALVTHALFVGDAEERLEGAGISDIASTDSVAHRSNRIRLADLLASALEEAADR